MNKPNTNPIPSSREIAERGEAIYKEKYAKTLEASDLGKYVAININNEDVTISDTSEGAVRGAFAPTKTMVPELSNLLGPTGKPFFKMVEQEGPSAAQKTAQAVVKSIKAVPAWMKANPVKAIGVEAVAHELGVDPIQLAHKLLKYGGELVP